MLCCARLRASFCLCFNLCMSHKVWCVLYAIFITTLPHLLFLWMTLFLVLVVKLRPLVCIYQWQRESKVTQCAALNWYLLLSYDTEIAPCERTYCYFGGICSWTHFVGYAGPRKSRQSVCSCPRDREGLSCEKCTWVLYVEGLILCNCQLFCKILNT